MLDIFIFQDIDFKLGTLMYYGFLTNIVMHNFFLKISIFGFIDTFMKKNLDFVILIQIYFMFKF